MIWITLVLTIFLSLSFLYLMDLYLKKKGSSLKKILTAQFKYTKRLVRTKRILSLFGIYLLLGAVVFTFYNLGNRIAFTRIHSGYSEWRESNGEAYLFISADDYYDLGYHTGNGLASNIALMKYELMISSLMFGIDYFSMINVAKQYMEYIPEDYLLELYGMSEGASAGSGFYLSFEDILVQSLFLEIIYGRVLPSKTISFGCTAFGTINSNNESIIGQNIDLIKPMGACGAFVLHQFRNDPLVFTYRIGACTLPMGKNEHNIVINMNLVQLNIVSELTIPYFVLARDVFSQCNTIEQCSDKFFQNHSLPYGCNLLIAQNEKILAVQCLPNEINLNYPNSTVVHSNTYLNETWQDKLADPTYSKARQDYAEVILQSAYEDKELTDSELISLLGNKPIICRDEGGLTGDGTVAFLTSTHFGIGTVHENVGLIPI
ncbi:MAG: hypothetical protein EU531_11300 [Promethearchaeota archaeon]|nr:MAG: hypothetical protein EU531_11300 [Candidatus Lokiarchaeota archaeon]